MLDNLLTALWLSAIGAWFVALASYHNQAGQVSSADEPMTPDAEHAWLLVMAVHPECPCTQASLAELDRLLCHVGREVECRAFIMVSPDTTQLPKTAILRRASRIPGLALISDPNGKSAGRLGIRTSGGVVLFDREGNVRYSGGLTSSRGHEGDNRGVAAIRALVETGQAEHSSGPVFGCPLTSE